MRKSKDKTSMYAAFLPVSVYGVPWLTWSGSPSMGFLCFPNTWSTPWTCFYQGTPWTDVIFKQQRHPMPHNYSTKNIFFALSRTPAVFNWHRTSSSITDDISTCPPHHAQFCGFLPHPATAFFFFFGLLFLNSSSEDFNCQLYWTRLTLLQYNT